MLLPAAAPWYLAALLHSWPPPLPPPRTLIPPAQDASQAYRPQPHGVNLIYRKRHWAHPRGQVLEKQEAPAERDFMHRCEKIERKKTPSLLPWPTASY